jgi:hypothetical protein
MTAPFEPGDFVWTNFPFEADPNHPGPGRHAALIMATFGTREAAQISAKPAPKLHTITIEAQDIGYMLGQDSGSSPTVLPGCGASGSKRAGV